MGRKLIGIDLDHTTLNEAGEVSAQTRKTLQAAQNDGHIISIITGRPPRMATDIYDTIGLKSPMINFNGALGSIPRENWKDEYSFQLKHDIVFDLLEQAGNLGIKTIVAENKHDFYGDSLSIQPAEDAVYFPKQTDSKKMLEHLSLQVNVNTIILNVIDPLQQANIKQLLLERYGSDNITVTLWGKSVLEITPAGVSKVTGLDLLSKSFAIAKDDIYAFGDGMNDFAMLDFATHGIVMANGHPDLKAIADDVTTYSNEDDGLARYLEKLLNLK
ncbi:MAG: Cof-type HAD-IIB family hydrolase [Lactobacillaceae bacterium]|jgi:Cof subfamily protein (haloacid dehalogenase superfamily)|nr:Cof-type HAD-IIB family hydrolase [Lactobacillaceae bacterium]